MTKETELETSIVLVTGGAVRMGAAISREFAKRGYRVAIHYAHSGKAATALRSEIAGNEREHAVFCADLGVASEAEQLIGRVNKEMGAVSVLVNNAAIFPVDDSLKNLGTESWQEVLDINLRAPAILSRAFARQPGFGSGNIVNIVDGRINRPGADHLAYRASKAGLADLTRNLALELAPDICVNGVSPGAILPPPGRSMGWLEQEKRGQIPLATTGSTKMIAESVLYFVEQPFITGQILSVDGGEFLA